MYNLFLNYGIVPESRSIDNGEFKIVKTILRLQLEGGAVDKWNKISNTCVGAFGYISTRVHLLYIM